MLSDPMSLAIVKCHFPTSCDVSSRSFIFSVRWGGEPKSVTSLVKKKKKKKDQSMKDSLSKLHGNQIMSNISYTIFTSSHNNDYDGGGDDDDNDHDDDDDYDGDDDDGGGGGGGGGGGDDDDGGGDGEDDETVGLLRSNRQ